MATSTATTIGAFFAAVITRLNSQTSLASNRIFVVDKLRLQDSAVPNFQIEPVSMTILGDETGLNVFQLEFRVHAVVKVEYDFASKPTQALTRATASKGAFQYAVDIGSALNKHEVTGSENIVIMSVINGGMDDVTGLAHATITFRTLLRVYTDG